MPQLSVKIYPNSLHNPGSRSIHRPAQAAGVKGCSAFPPRIISESPLLRHSDDRQADEGDWTGTFSEYDVQYNSCDEESEAGQEGARGRKSKAAQVRPGKEEEGRSALANVHMVTPK